MEDSLLKVDSGSLRAQTGCLLTDGSFIAKIKIIMYVLIAMLPNVIYINNNLKVLAPVAKVAYEMNWLKIVRLSL